ncbi:hypothetical protein [Phormidium sp. CCY1219]|uniref:hypothetical protein n=1 Tax=Phormidium sp. CCY1219 TaxID=2886104 RepID=UPI002D1F7EFF|nr:hypothetical protein [Phormidium sp. CCY1219]MEB3830772.1 hypothetical protein [Phormidium sp. CCY1219]
MTELRNGIDLRSARQKFTASLLKLQSMGNMQRSLAQGTTETSATSLRLGSGQTPGIGVNFRARS